MNLKPREEFAISSLIPALQQGLDPMLALQLYQQTIGGAQDRIAQQQAIRLQQEQEKELAKQQTLAQIGQFAMENAASYEDIGQLAPLLQGLAASLPYGKTPMVQRGIEDVTSNLAQYSPPSGGFPGDAGDMAKITESVKWFTQNGITDYDQMVDALGTVPELQPLIQGFQPGSELFDQMIRPVIEDAMGNSLAPPGLWDAFWDTVGNPSNWFFMGGPDPEEGK